MAVGIIVKALSGFYYVLSDGNVTRCKPRGVFRHEKMTPLVGDEVEFTASEGSDGTINRLLPRRNYLLRPSVANIDQLIIIISAVTPVADPFVVDRMVSLSEHYSIEPVICLNKADLGTDKTLTDIYLAAGYKVLIVSAETGEGLDELISLLADKISAFAGNSGVGKSSLLNRICPELSLATGDVSEKLGRGRHTTRHVELFALSSGGMVADTPGFSFFDPDFVLAPDCDELWKTFREFRSFDGQCRYVDCSHTKEKGCAIIRAVQDGEISYSRHKSYCLLYDEAKKIKPWEREQAKQLK